MRPLEPKAGARGFTIVELLVVIVIISILVAIAIPSYRQYIMRTNRTVAKAALQDVLTRQENYAVDHKTYALSFDGLGIGSTGGTATAYVTSDGKISDVNTGNAALYQLKLLDNITTTCGGSTPTGRALTIAVTAAPVGTNQDTVCGTLCIGSNGDRGSTVGTVADCWRR